MENLLFDVGGGRVSARGEIADKLDLAVNIRDLPLAISNMIKPDLALGGTLNGTANIGETRPAPCDRVRGPSGPSRRCRGRRPAVRNRMPRCAAKSFRRASAGQSRCA